MATLTLTIDMDRLAKYGKKSDRAGGALADALATFADQYGTGGCSVVWTSTVAAVGTADWTPQTPEEIGAQRKAADMIASDAIEAATLLASTLGDLMTAGDTAGHFNCGEANDIAEALVLLGKREAAVTFLAGHAFGDDDPDDQHRHLGRGDEGGAFDVDEEAVGTWLDAYLDGTLPEDGDEDDEDDDAPQLVVEEDPNAHLPKCVHCGYRVYMVEGTLVKAENHSAECYMNPAGQDAGHERPTA